MPSPKIQTPSDTKSSLYVIIQQPAHHAGVMQLRERVDTRCNATLLIYDSQASILILGSLKLFFFLISYLSTAGSPLGCGLPTTLYKTQHGHGAPTQSARPAVPVVAELGLRAALLFADYAAAAERHVAPDPVVRHGAGGSGGAPHGDLLAEEALVRLLEAALADAQPAAAAEGAAQDVLRAHAAVRGLPEEIRVVPVVFALAEDVPDQQLPPGALEAAPRRDQHGQEHGAQGPHGQAPVGHGAGGIGRALHPCSSPA